MVDLKPSFFVNVGITIINHPPVITIVGVFLFSVMGGKHGIVKYPHEFLFQRILQPPSCHGVLPGTSQWRRWQTALESQLPMSPRAADAEHQQWRWSPRGTGVTTVKRDPE